MPRYRLFGCAGLAALLLMPFKRNPIVHLGFQILEPCQGIDFGEDVVNARTRLGGNDRRRLLWDSADCHGGLHCLCPEPVALSDVTSEELAVQMGVWASEPGPRSCASVPPGDEGPPSVRD